MPLLFINLWIKAAGQPRIWRFRGRGISGFLGEMGWGRRVGSVTQALQTSIMLVSIWTKLTLCKHLNSKVFLMSVSGDIWTALAAASSPTVCRRCITGLKAWHKAARNGWAWSRPSCRPCSTPSPASLPARWCWQWCPLQARSGTPSRLRLRLRRRRRGAGCCLAAGGNRARRTAT